jgi:TonB-linked SusC/RagA family outer membrane protein
MKQRYPIFALLLFFAVGSFSAFAQRTVTGNVTDAGGNGMPGVNVIVKGTSAGTTTDATGHYSIAVNEDATTLVFSFIGYSTQEVLVGNRTSVDISMAEDARELSEVVVTALGVERSVKSLQYSMTSVSGDNFQEARTNNLANQLAGRVAGVNVSQIAGGPAGSSRVVIRGNKSLLGNNQPLYVVDGIPMDNSGFGQAGLWGGRDQGDGMSSINPDDIESVTVLKGANAAALYGARAANGVINIVTKKGTAKSGIGIDFTSNFVFERVNDLREYQTEYGEGNFDRSDPANQYSERIPYAPRTQQEGYNWSTSSWGPRLGSVESSVGFDGLSRPYVDAGDNFSRYFQTGTSHTNTLALTGGSATQNFRISFSNLTNKSIVPNSGFERKNVSLATNSKFGEKVTFVSKVLYSHEYADNRPYLSDSPSNGVLSMYYMPANHNVDMYRGDPSKLGSIPVGVDPASLSIWQKIPGEEYQFANNNWHQNPWWTAYQFDDDDWRDRLITSGQLRYDINDWLYVQARGGMDWYTRRVTNLVPQGTGHTRGGAMNEREFRVRETNLEWMAGFDKTFSDFSFNAFVGGNVMRRSFEEMNLNGTGFSVPFEPFINNTITRSWGYGFNQSGINSMFGSAQVGYKEILFLTATARQDWFSVLNPENNSILYPSVGASFVFSDAFTMPAIISFGKLRASWAQVGSATIGAYDTNLTYSLNGNSHNGYTMASFSTAGGNDGLIPNPDLKPMTSTEFEFGLDMRFLQDRLALDLTYYNQRTTDDILNARISRGSGFGRTSVNVGELENKGIELLLRGTPIVGDFTWDVSLNIAKNNNKVISLIAGNNELIIEEPRSRNAFIKHVVGHPFGVITGRVQDVSPGGDPLITFGGFAIEKDPVTGQNVKDPITGKDVIARDANGVPIVIADGRPVQKGNFEILGNGVPDLTGGLMNSFSYKNFNVGVLVDFKFGGDILSGTNMRLTSSGLTEMSLMGRAGEESLIVDGVVKVPTLDADDRDSDGDTDETLSSVDKSLLTEDDVLDEYRPFTNTVYVSGGEQIGTDPVTGDPIYAPVYSTHTGALTPDQARNYWGAVQGETNAKTDLFLYDASFVKLRQVTVGYTFPRKMLTKTPFQNVTLSFVARNLAILYKDVPNIDPESSYQNGNGQGLDYFGFPATRSYGFDLKVQF